MMDMSSLVDASLVLLGVVSAVVWAWATIESGSTTVSASPTHSSKSVDSLNESNYRMAA